MSRATASLLLLIVAGHARSTDAGQPGPAEVARSPVMPGVAGNRAILVQGTMPSGREGAGHLRVYDAAELAAGRPALQLDVADRLPTFAGVDRSVPAVIGPSPFAGRPDRPTVIYVAAADGALHAFCAADGEGCRAGAQLWAHVPSVGRIVGSPRVADVYAGTPRAWRTILVVEGDTALHALDITDPRERRPLWERAAAPRSAPAGTLALGPVLISAHLTYAVFHSRSAGGVVTVEAIEATGGAVLWTFAHDAARPTTGAVAGGPVAFDRAATGRLTDVLVPTLGGELHLVDAATGMGRATPLHEFAGRPPLHLSPAVVHGPAAGQLWVVAAAGATLVAVDLDGTARWTQSLPADITAQPTVSGDDLLVLTRRGATGLLHVLSAADGAPRVAGTPVSVTDAPATAADESAFTAGPRPSAHEALPTSLPNPRLSVELRGLGDIERRVWVSP